MPQTTLQNQPTSMKVTVIIWERPTHKFTHRLVPSKPVLFPCSRGLPQAHSDSPLNTVPESKTRHSDSPLNTVPESDTTPMLHTLLTFLRRRRP